MKPSFLVIFVCFVCSSDLCFLALEEVSKVKNLTKRVVFLSLVFLAEKVVVLVVVLDEICCLSLDLGKFRES